MHLSGPTLLSCAAAHMECRVAPALPTRPDGYALVAPPHRDRAWCRARRLPPVTQLRTTIDQQQAHIQYLVRARSMPDAAAIIRRLVGSGSSAGAAQEQDRR